MPSNPLGEFIQVRWQNPRSVQTILIYESFNAGAVYRVRLYDEYGKEHEVYRRNFEQLQPVNRPYLRITLNRPTSYKVVSIKIDMATHVISGWNHIDALGVASCAEIQWPYPLDNTHATSNPASASSLFTQHPQRDYFTGFYDPTSRRLYYTYQSRERNSQTEAGLAWRKQDSSGQWSSAHLLTIQGEEQDQPAVWATRNQGQEILVNDTTPGGHFRWIEQMANKNWSTSDSMNLPIQNSSPYLDLYISPSNQLAIISAQLEHTYGGRDIYLMTRTTSGTWSKPFNLGSAVNSSHADFSPFLSSDETTLYFASQGHTGYGAADLYVARRLDGSWDNWSAPINLGPTINNEGWNAFPFILTGQHLVYTSQNRAGNFRLLGSNIPDSLAPEPTNQLQFRILKDGKPCFFEGQIRYRSTLTSGHSPLQGDDFTLVLPHYVTHFQLALDSDTGEWETPIRIRATAASLDTLIILRLGSAYTPFPNDKLLFEKGTAVLLPESFEVLDSLQRYLLANSGKHVLLQGHTDYEGKAHDNAELSYGRVQAIKKWLATHRIAAERIAIQSYGEEQPLYIGDNSRKRMRNRRVKILLYDE